MRRGGAEHRITAGRKYDHRAVSGPLTPVIRRYSRSLADTCFRRPGRIHRPNTTDSQADSAASILVTLSQGKTQVAGRTLLPRRFRSSVASLPAVRVGFLSSTVAELVERCADVLTPLLTMTLDTGGRAWSRPPPTTRLNWAGCKPWTSVDNARLTRNLSLLAS
jgi:hypothetical protein